MADWKSIFRSKLLKIMYDIDIYQYHTTPTNCAGGWNTDRNEYDSEADAAYHIAHPTAPTCHSGKVGTIEKVETHGFYFSTLTESQMAELGIGVLDVNEGVYICDGYIDLTNAIAIEYPTGQFHSFIYKRNLSVGDDVIAQYAVVRKTNTITADPVT